jgi:hypothetical protein
MGNALYKQFLKGHAMSNVCKKKSPLEIADLILKHSPGASMETIANVISEWGGLFDDHRYGEGESIDFESAAPNGHSQSRSLNSGFPKSVKQLDS